MSALADEDQRTRCLSFDSLHEEEGLVTIELTEDVLLDASLLKSTFSRTIDSCLADLISDQVLIADMSSTRFYEYTYLLSKITEVSFNFTGLTFDKLRTVIMDYLSKR